jgi:DNA/RNA-binding domain of Phe-tRNA-synthetase-like protein
LEIALLTPDKGMESLFKVTDAWSLAFPGAHVGVLIIKGVLNPASHAGLGRRKQALMSEMRTRLGGLERSQLKMIPSLQVYDAYYKRFNKTYHVLLQLESITFKGKSFPNGSALVEAMFMAEIRNMLLTAGHDLDLLQLPIRLDVTKGDETYIQMRGQLQQVKPGDMIISDGTGIISNIIYGPDQRTQIQPGTRNVLYTAYAPAGIHAQALIEHLQDIREYVGLFAPDARTELLQVFG